MKRDCGGAAGLLGAFYSTVKLGFSENLHAIFCLAENAIGPNAQRPDDIVKMYSGRSVLIVSGEMEKRFITPVNNKKNMNNYYRDFYCTVTAVSITHFARAVHMSKYQEYHV